jgi:hypothetical protein
MCRPRQISQIAMNIFRLLKNMRLVTIQLPVTASIGFDLEHGRRPKQIPHVRHSQRAIAEEKVSIPVEAALSADC